MAANKNTCVTSCKPFDEEWFECECHSSEHIVKFSFDGSEGTLYTTIHLKRFGFFKRLFVALMYIFGKECRYGSFEEILIQPEKSERFFEIAKKFNDFHN